MTELERLREALKPFADAAQKYEYWRDGEEVDHAGRLFVSDLRRAALASEGKPVEPDYHERHQLMEMAEAAGQPSPASEKKS